eukprot:321479-Amphidinium_carterae.1
MPTSVACLDIRDYSPNYKYYRNPTYAPMSNSSLLEATRFIRGSVHGTQALCLLTKAVFVLKASGRSTTITHNHGATAR